MTANADSVAKLQAIPEFMAFARRKMSADPERWRKEAVNGVGFARQLAEAVVAVAGGGQRGP